MADSCQLKSSRKKNQRNYRKNVITDYVPDNILFSVIHLNYTRILVLLIFSKI